MSNLQLAQLEKDLVKKTCCTNPRGINIPSYPVSDMVSSMCLTTCHRCFYVLQSDRISTWTIFKVAIVWLTSSYCPENEISRF